jgi:cytochrome c oxidase cbb3-type subunit 3
MKLRLHTHHVLLLLTIGVAASLGVRYLERAHMEQRLLDAWPDSAALDPALVRFAADRAVPALTEHCAVCHGADLHGDRLHGAPDLVDKEWIFGEGRVVDIEQTINHGIRSGDHRDHDLADMPGFLRANPYARYHIDSLEPAEIADLAAFILRLNGREAVDRLAASRGKALFSKALCYDCHTASAQGDPSIGAPSLAAHGWLFGSSPETLVDVIAYGRAGICPAWGGRLPPVTVRAIAIYLHERSEKSS